VSEPLAPIYEVFSAIQGEGILVGVRQVFVRFCCCNRACRYCDTEEARTASATCAIEMAPASRQFTRVANPLSVSRVEEAVAALNPFPGLHHSVSLTGGEPLCHADFLVELCPRLRARGFSTFLETNGTLPEALERIIGQLDHVAMDVKMASATGEPTDWEAHRRFLAVAAAKPTQVKIIVSAETSDDELRRLADLVGEAAPATPVVLQPVTPHGGALAPSAAQLLDMQAGLLRRLADVRVIPQAHKLMGQK